MDTPKIVEVDRGSPGPFHLVTLDSFRINPSILLRFSFRPDRELRNTGTLPQGVQGNDFGEGN